MQLDLILDARLDAGRLAELGALAEDAGIRRVWVSSLLDSRDPFTNFSRLALATERLEMGVIAVNPYDTHPVKLAASLLTLNELSRGRARIVVGGGGEALQALNIQPTRRVRAVRECIEIIRLAATGETITYEGGLYTARNLRLGWLTAPPPPLYAAANQVQMLSMSARVADGVMVSDLPAPLAQVPINTLAGALTESGKRPTDYWTNVFTAWHVYDDRNAAYREARQWLFLRGIFRPWVLETFLDPDEVDQVMASQSAFFDAFRNQSDSVRGVPGALLDKLVDGLTLAGPLDELDRQIEHLRQYQALGFSAVALRLYQQPEMSIETIGRRVLPALRSSR